MWAFMNEDYRSLTGEDLLTIKLTSEWVLEKAGTQEASNRTIPNHGATKSLRNIKPVMLHPSMLRTRS